MRNQLREKFSVVNVDGVSVKSFGGMPPPASADDTVGAPLMFTGVQILEPRIFDYIPRGVFSHSTTDVYPKAIAAGEQISAHVATGRWYELSTIERYRDINLKLMGEQGRVVWMGSGCRISEKARVRDSVIWDEVTVEDNATVHGSILGDGVTVRTGQVVSNACVVRVELIRNSAPPPKALAGSILGDNFVVPLAQ